MKKTLLYLWLEPLIMNNKRCDKKVYFNVIVSGSHSKTSTEELEKLLEGKLLANIMDIGNIYTNNDFGIISATSYKGDNEVGHIEFTDTPDERKKQKDIQSIISSKKEIELSKKNFEIKEHGVIEVSLPNINLKQEFDFSKIWTSIEKNIQGKIKEGDKAVLTDDNGNTILEIIGGSFLNIGFADLSIYDAKKMIHDASIFNSGVGLKGGLYIRDDGSMDIGDIDRTFWIKIYTNHMLKQSLKLGKTLNEIGEVKMKLLK